jgi:molybdopterin molybdotransferase
MLPLMNVDEARKRILQRISPLGIVRIPVAVANGRVLAEDIFSQVDLPAFSNSAVDGFAVLHEDVEHASHAAPVNLLVVADIPAGQYSQHTLQHGQAARL